MALNAEQKIFNLTKDVYEIAQYFMESLQVKYFVYTSFYPNKGVLALCSDAEIMKTSLELGCTPPSETYTGLSVPKGVYLANPAVTSGSWIQEGLIMQRERFDIDHPLTLIVTRSNNVETFTFMTHKDDHNFINNTLNQLELFWQFTHYFKEKAKPLLKILVVTPLSFSNTVEIIKVPKPFLTAKQKLLLLTKIVPNKYLFEHNGQEVLISKRQSESLQQLFLGKTVKEIANSLGIKSSTVQDYLDELKNKLHCTNREELIAIFLKNMPVDQH